MKLPKLLRVSHYDSILSTRSSSLVTLNRPSNLSHLQISDLSITQHLPWWNSIPLALHQLAPAATTYSLLSCTIIWNLASFILPYTEQNDLSHLTENLCFCEYSVRKLHRILTKRTEFLLNLTDHLFCMYHLDYTWTDIPGNDFSLLVLLTFVIVIIHYHIIQWYFSCNLDLVKCNSS